jgi:hypothetical protein
VIAPLRYLHSLTANHRMRRLREASTARSRQLAMYAAQESRRQRTSGDSTRDGQPQGVERRVGCERPLDGVQRKAS